MNYNAHYQKIPILISESIGQFFIYFFLSTDPPNTGLCSNSTSIQPHLLLFNIVLLTLFHVSPRNWCIMQTWKNSLKQPLRKSEHWSFCQMARTWMTCMWKPYAIWTSSSIWLQHFNLSSWYTGQVFSLAGFLDVGL